MKRLLYCLILALPVTTSLPAQTVTITESGGRIESAFIKWQPLAETVSFSVYYSGEGISNRRIDVQLIRSYGSYYRADIPVLKAGKYTTQVVPVIDGEENDTVETGAITVSAHDRTGYSFWNGSVPGAYNADWTPKDGVGLP